MKNALTTNYTDDTDAGKPYPSSPVKSLVKLLLTFSLVLTLAAPALRAQREKLPPADLDYVEKTWPEAKKTVTGIRYLLLKEGQGPMPKPGDKVNVLYVGKLLNGTVFDQATEPDKPFTFRVQRDMVIEGWDQVLQLMKAGEKRLVIIPPELAYGTRGQPPKIGRSASLVFEIELLSFGKD
jgi:FKBP-type peptidyl-prolyl cis-trans isomerase